MVGVLRRRVPSPRAVNVRRGSIRRHGEGFILLTSLIAPLLGVAFSLCLVRLARTYPPRRERRVYAVGLGVAALLYVAFGVVGDVGHDGLERRVQVLCRGPAGGAGVAAAVHADARVAPRLLRDPVDDGVGVPAVVLVRDDTVGAGGLAAREGDDAGVAVRGGQPRPGEGAARGFGFGVDREEEGRGLRPGDARLRTTTAVTAALSFVLMRTLSWMT